VPQLFCADGNIKIRLTDRNGVTQIVQDNLLVVGPSGGGGGGGIVDPTTIFQTGAFMQFYGTGNLTGWVRCNGRTIGSATSGATERSNADTQALFQFLWGADANLPVSGGRGASPNADWVANKTIALPDCRGRALAGLDDMGNAAAGRLTATYVGATATVLGAAGGSQSHTQTVAEIASHFHSASIFDLTHTHSHNMPGPVYNGATAGNIAGGTGAGFTTLVISAAATGVRVNSSNGLDTTNSAGSGAPFSVVNPMLLATTYLKL
jgi:hypothetical protein